MHNDKKPNDTILPSFQSLLSTLGVSNESTSPSRTTTTTNTWTGIFSSTSQPIPQFESTCPTFSHSSTTNIVTTSPTISHTEEFQYTSPSTLQQHVTRNATLSPNLSTLPFNDGMLGSTSTSTSSGSGIGTNFHYQFQQSPIIDEKIKSSTNSESTSTTTNLDKQFKKGIKFINQKAFKTSNFTIPQPLPSQPLIPLPSPTQHEHDITSVTFSMEKQSQPKKKRKTRKLSLPILNNQSESTNSDQSSNSSSLPIESKHSSSNMASGSNTSPTIEKSTDPIVNSGMFMEFVGTSTKKRKQYRDIINYKDEFFTDSYSSEKRLRESNTKYRSKQPLNPNNKKSEKK